MPAADGGTTNVAVKLPTFEVEKVAWGGVVQELPPVHVSAWLTSQVRPTVELAANPVPVTVTVAPTTPETGESVILEVTVNRAVAELAFDEPSVPVNV